jgi:cell division protein FtsB
MPSEEEKECIDFIKYHVNEVLLEIQSLMDMAALHKVRHQVEAELNKLQSDAYVEAARKAKPPSRIPDPKYIV